MAKLNEENDKRRQKTQRARAMYGGLTSNSATP